MTLELTNKNDIPKTLTLIEELYETSIITDKDVKAISDCKKFIADTYFSVPMYRPLVVKLFGVLNSKEFPTDDMKFWQCKVEAEVHASELVRDIHDMELQKNQIDRAKYVLEKMKDKEKTSVDEEIKFDIKEQELIISKKMFELLQLSKRIKYRIEEVNEWRLISETLTKNKDFKNKNYAQILSDSLKNKFVRMLNDPNLSEKEKINVQAQIKTLDEISNVKLQ